MSSLPAAPRRGGAERLLRFEEFIQQEAEKTAQSRKKALAEEYKDFVGQSVLLGMDEELFAEVEVLDEALASETRAFETALAARYETIKTALSSREWNKVDAVPPSPAARLQTLTDRLNKEAETLENLTDEKARSALQTQFEELDARLRLGKVKASVLTAIERLDRQAKLAKCLSAVKTKPISDKASDLAEKVVSKDLEEALNLEFKSLGVGNLQVCLKSRVDKGKAFHKLKLNLPQAKTPIDILSEGEQRAIAIGSFLGRVRYLREGEWSPEWKCCSHARRPRYILLPIGVCGRTRGTVGPDRGNGSDRAPAFPYTRELYTTDG